MSRLPAQLQCSHLPHLLCTSLLPSGVAITAEARKQSRGCFKTARDPLPLQPRGWGRGNVPPISAQPQHGPQLLAQHLCRARGGHAQGQRVPKTCSTSGMRQQGWEKEGLPSSESSLPQCPTPSPAGCKGPAWVSTRDTGAGKHLGREGSEHGNGGTYPIPALRHGEELGGRGCSGSVGQAGGPGVGHGNTAAGAKLSSALAQPLASIYSGAPALR